ncbi:MAG: hypothetical protein FWH53_08145 [Leptospirales bacterium]|nr:hypothetical protein [Leptospirales bacterium]
MINKIARFAKFIKIFTISVLILIAALMIILWLVYYFYPEESVKDIIKNKAETALSRKIEIGSLHYSLKGVVIYNFIIYDKTADTEQQVLVKADEVVITFSLISIIKKDLKLRTIYLKGLVINCVFDNTGISNFEHLIAELKDDGDSSSDQSVQLSEIILNRCVIQLTNPPAYIKPLEGEYKIDSTIHIEEGGAFSISDTKLILPDNRGTLFPELKISTAQTFIIKGRVKVEDASLLWVYKFAKRDPQLPFEIANAQVNDLEITKNHVIGSAKATSTLKRSKNILHADGKCTVYINTKSVFLKDVKGKIDSSSLTVDDMIISSKHGEISRFSFSDISFQLSDARPLLSNLPAALSGSVKGHLSFNSTYSGRLDIIDLSYKDKTELFSGLTTTIEINNNILKKENIPITLLGNSSNISIATTDDKFKNFYVYVRTEKLNVNEIKLGDDKTGSEKVDIPVNITGRIEINDIIYDDLIFKNTKANIYASGNIIKVNNADTSILSGAIYGTGAIDLSGNAPALQANLKFNNIKLQDIKFKNEQMNNRFFGFADGTANINLLIKDNLTETIRGNASFSINKGKIVDTGVQNGLMIFLSELRYKLKNLEFNRIYGNIDIANGNLSINSFIFNSEDLRLSLNGQLDKDLIAKDMGMKLEFNNHFIKDIPRPAMAMFNEYSSGAWFTIPFSINGAITEGKNIKMLKKNQ